LRLEAGFTLTELVAVIALLAITAAVAGPRFFRTDTFHERFGVDAVRGALGYAQKLAIATGCEVQVSFSGGGFDVRRRAACTSGAFTAPVPDPGTGSAGYSGTLPGGVTVASSVDPLVFDALGQARDSGGTVVDAALTVGTRSLSVDGATGFAHSP
jgi:MSHA pilin protein MshC